MTEQKERMNSDEYVHAEQQRIGRDYQRGGGWSGNSPRLVNFYNDENLTIVAGCARVEENDNFYILSAISTASSVVANERVDDLFFRKLDFPDADTKNGRIGTYYTTEEYISNAMKESKNNPDAFYINSNSKNVRIVVRAIMDKIGT